MKNIIFFLLLLSSWVSGFSQTKTTFPNIALKNSNGESVQLVQLLSSREYSIVIWNTSWGSFGRRQLKLLTDNWGELNNQDVQLISVFVPNPRRKSVVNPQDLLFPNKKLPDDFTILIDVENDKRIPSKTGSWLKDLGYHGMTDPTFLIVKKDGSILSKSRGYSDLNTFKAALGVPTPYDYALNDLGKWAQGISLKSLPDKSELLKGKAKAWLRLGDNILLWKDKQWQGIPLKKQVSNVGDVFITSSGEILLAGIFRRGMRSIQGIAKWTGSDWQVQEHGGGHFDVRKIFTNSENNLFAFGDFTNTLNPRKNTIAAFNGNSWENLGNGLDGKVKQIVFSKNGKILAGGDFWIRRALLPVSPKIKELVQQGKIEEAQRLMQGKTASLALWTGKEWTYPKIYNEESDEQSNWLGIKEVTDVAFDKDDRPTVSLVYLTTNYQSGAAIFQFFLEKWNRIDTSLEKKVNPIPQYPNSYQITKLLPSEKGHLYAAGIADIRQSASANTMKMTYDMFVAQWNGSDWQILTRQLKGTAIENMMLDTETNSLLLEGNFLNSENQDQNFFEIKL